jgi:membrane-associated phospholipid phosphatase
VPPATIDRRRLDVWTAVGGLATLVVCGLIARSGTTSAPEQAVFEAINGLPEELEPAMNAAQFLGVLAVGPAVAVVALVLRRYRLAIAATIITASKLVAERVIWEIVQRDRPGVTEPNAIVRGDTPLTGRSFVSGHVVLVSALAWAITPYLRGGWKFAPWSVVVLVAFARIYLGAHNPVDVVGGLALGLALGAIANLAVGVPTARLPTQPNSTGAATNDPYSVHDPS